MNRIQTLIEILPNAEELSGLLICNGISIKENFIWDFYDGPLEGFLIFSKSKHLMYYNKVWWDKDYNARVYECYFITFEKVFSFLGVSPSDFAGKESLDAWSDRQIQKLISFSISDEKSIGATMFSAEFSTLVFSPQFLS